MFKVGEEVVVKRGNRRIDGDCINYPHGMAEYEGGTYTIRDARMYEGRPKYQLSEVGFSWRGEWLEDSVVIQIGGE